MIALIAPADETPNAVHTPLFTVVCTQRTLIPVCTSSSVVRQPVPTMAAAPIGSLSVMTDMITVMYVIVSTFINIWKIIRIIVEQYQCIDWLMSMYIPVQLNPSELSWYPERHSHLYPPAVLLQSCSQLCVSNVHSSISNSVPGYT